MQCPGAPQSFSAKEPCVSCRKASGGVCERLGGKKKAGAASAAPAKGVRETKGSLYWNCIMMRPASTITAITTQSSTMLRLSAAEPVPCRREYLPRTRERFMKPS